MATISCWSRLTDGQDEEFDPRAGERLDFPGIASAFPLQAAELMAASA
jgi:hypothetical protein